MIYSVGVRIEDAPYSGITKILNACFDLNTTATDIPEITAHMIIETTMQTAHPRQIGPFFTGTGTAYFSRNLNDSDI